MRKISTLASIALAMVVCAGMALAHGGTYQGPQGGGTPGYSGPAGGGTHGPNPGNPDPGSGGGTTPGTGGGGTTGGGANPSGPVRPGRPSSGGARVGGRGGTTPGRTKAKSDNRFDDWDWWWDLNEERFLNLKQKIRASATASDNKDTFLGEDIEEDVAKVTLRNIRKEILPTLILALKDPYYDARAGAVIALGKIGDAAQTELIDRIRELLADENKSVRESACLGLGILGSQDAIDLLFKIVNNEPEARRLMGREQKNILTRTRTFASVAIGLIGSREGFEDSEVSKKLLALTASKGSEADKDLQVGPALALGVVRSQEAVPRMLEILNDEDINNYVRAHVAVALGKVGAKTAIPDLVKCLSHKEAHIARSACISLGLLASREDTDTCNKLIRQAKSGKDRAVRNFAMIALGEQGHPKGIAWLQNMARTGKVIHDQAFAALGLGLAGFKYGEGNAAGGEILLAEYKRQRGDAKKAPLAIAMGLLGYEAAAATLREELDRGGSQDLKGHICTALGLLLDKDSIPQIQKLVRQKGDTDLRKRASVALGLMGDAGAVDVLEKVIEESSNSKAVLGAATVALGYVGDRRAVPILTKMVENSQNEYQDSTRAFATVALGFLGDKDAIPLLSKVQENSNYLAQTAALAELLSIL